MRKGCLLTLGVFLSIASCAVYYYWGKTTVTRTLAREIRRGPGTAIDLALVAPFEWQRMYVFQPYATKSRVNQCLGFSWSGFDNTSLESSEGYNLVVFVERGRVVYWFEFPRDEGELAAIAAPNGYGRDEARFVVIKEDNGRLGLATVTRLSPDERERDVHQLGK